MKHKCMKSNKKGFTLIELLVVTVILSGIVLASLNSAKNTTYTTGSETTSITNMAETELINFKNEDQAYDDCVEKVKKYFNIKQVSATAVNTGYDFSTYDCYGLKYTKIP